MSDRAKGNAAAGGSDADDVRVVDRNPRGRREMILYLALFVAAGYAGYAVTPRPGTPMPPPAAERSAVQPMAVGARQQPENEEATPPRPSKVVAPALVSATRRTTAPRAVEQEEEGDTSLDLSDFIPPGERPTAGQVIEELHKRGIYDGIGAFPPPGTSPPMVGLAVPEDFELPEGYVRHHQSTDDGQPIEPILMFSPDYEFFDENGNPIPIPDDRVVPAELAPPGLPTRDIEIPPDREP